MDRNTASTFAKGMAVLKAFDHGPTGMTLAGIARASGLDRAAVRRLTLTLVDLGYVAKTGRSYALTPKVLVLAGSFLRGNHFGTRIQPILSRHASALGADISMAVMDDAAAVYVAKATLDTTTVSFGFTIGSRLPLLHTAIGRMLLASTGIGIDDLPLHPHTPHSIMDRIHLAQQISTIRTQGFAVVSGEFEPGVTGISVPMAPVAGVEAVLGASAPQLSLDPADAQKRFIAGLQGCAAELGHALRNGD